MALAGWHFSQLVWTWRATPFGGKTRGSDGSSDQRIRKLTVTPLPNGVLLDFETNVATIPVVEVFRLVRDAQGALRFNPRDSVAVLFDFLTGTLFSEHHAHVVGLDQTTSYSYRITAGDGPRAQAVATGTFRTGRRTAGVVIREVQIWNDGDPGLKGSGELSFVLGLYNRDDEFVAGRGFYSAKTKILSCSTVLARVGALQTVHTPSGRAHVFGLGPDGVVAQRLSRTAGQRRKEWARIPTGGAESITIVAHGERHADLVTVCNGIVRAGRLTLGSARPEPTEWTIIGEEMQPALTALRLEDGRAVVVGLTRSGEVRTTLLGSEHSGAVPWSALGGCFVGRVAALATEDGLALFAVTASGEVRSTCWRPGVELRRGPGPVGGQRQGRQGPWCRRAGSRAGGVGLPRRKRRMQRAGEW